jgi:UDP-N-acetylmuramyl pentapeptide phosphotransferase/UDP-N-acetylglucosamine-1-phosphate transferase
VSRAAGRIALIGFGALAAAGALRAIRAAPGADRLDRTNFHGRPVSLAGGPALAVAATAVAALGAGTRRRAVAAVVAGGVSGAVGLYDDIAGARPEQKAAKGFHGHLAALRQGRLTGGLVKIAGVGLAGLAASALVEAGQAAAAPRGHAGRRPDVGRRDDAGRPAGALGRLVDLGLGAGVVAGLANLVNLLDLRPGRAGKAGLLIGAPLLAGTSAGLVAGPVGATGALLPLDLDEQIMLGDAGANALGALLGLGVIAATGRRGRAVMLAMVAALTAASERVSFTQVIASTPGLRELDALGRRTDHDIAG